MTRRMDAFPILYLYNFEHLRNNPGLTYMASLEVLKADAEAVSAATGCSVAEVLWFCSPECGPGQEEFDELAGIAARMRGRNS